MAVNNLLTAEASVLFENLNWPMPDDEEWRRTDLSRLLPPGILESGAEATWADRAAAEISRAQRNSMYDCPDSEPGGPEADQRVSASADGSPAGRLSLENYAAHIVTEAGRPVSITLSPKAAEAGLAVEWADFGDFPESLIRMGADELRSSRERITAWHWRDLSGSLVLRVSRGSQITEPVLVEEHLVVPDENRPLISLPHLHIEAEESASLSVLWSFEGSPDLPKSVTPIINAALSAEAAADSSVNIILRQILSNRVVFFLHDRLSAARDARLRFHEAHFGGALVKSRVRTVLNGPGSEALLNGLLVASFGRHMDIGTRQEHRTPKAFSNALYKGAVSPGARSVFQGLIVVDPNASGTDAYLTNNNLLLGDGARADSLPQLDILTDDVKCSHGSTSGKIDPLQTFYLQSRGFSPEEARGELIRGFLCETLEGLSEEVAEILSGDLDAALAVG